MECVALDTHLGRGLEGRVHGDLWHVAVVDVLVAVPHTVDQVGLQGTRQKVFYFESRNTS